MVSNYIEDNCKYRLSKLVNVVYLINEDAVKDIRVDDGAAYIASISQTPMELGCYGIKLSESESLDERYKFTHTLTFSVNGYANKDNFDGRYYAIVKDEEGTYWLINPLFPCKVTYTYNLGYQEDHTDFTLSTVSNHPVLELKNFSAAKTSECKRYTLGGIDKLWLNERKYSRHVDNLVKYTNNGGFKEVDFKKTSGKLTETFDGNKISHVINFDIDFDGYKSSWHYNLLEFIDNTYASVIKTRNGEYTLCGFGYGMQPSFVVEADDSVQNINKISITLNDAHDNGNVLDFYDTINYEFLSARTWVYTSKYGGYECVADGIARYLLMMEIDAFENETRNYKVLAGYESLFPSLCIDGTFTETQIFYSQNCNGFGECLVYTSLGNMIFNDITCRNYSLRCDSDWDIVSSNSGITVSPSSGLANVDYTITVCNNIEPTSASVDSTLTINYCYNKHDNINVTVREYDGCLTRGKTYYISAEETTLTIPSKCCVNKVRETTSFGITLVVYSNRFIATVPKNNTGIVRTANLLVEYCDGSSETCTIIQDNVFRRWIDSGNTICIHNDEYQPQVLYTGTTEETLVPTEEIRNKYIASQTLKCFGALYRWVETGEEGCGGCLLGDNINSSSTFRGHYDYETGTMGNSHSGTQYGDFDDYIRNCPEDEYSKQYQGIEAVYSDICLSNNIIHFSLDSNNAKVDTIAIPPSVKTIGRQGYMNDDCIEEIIGCDGVVLIGEWAFVANNYIRNIILGEDLKAIGYCAFNRCRNLKNVIIMATTPPIIASDSFVNCSDELKIFVPRESLGAYKTANNWSNFPDNVIQAFN